MSFEGLVQDAYILYQFSGVSDYERQFYSANAWTCLHRFVYIFLQSHLAGLMSSGKRRLWSKHL